MDTIGSNSARIDSQPRKTRRLILPIIAALVYSPTTIASGWGLADWGTLVWGTSYNVPFIPLIGSLLLATILITITHRFGAKRIAPFLFVLFVPLIAVSVPNVFQNGTIADADEVNSNFTAVENLHTRSAFVQGFATHNHVGSTLVDVPGRNVIYNKLSASSSIKVTWYEFRMVNGASGVLRTCQWLLYEDGVIKEELSLGAIATPHNSSSTLTALISGTAAGTHDYTIRVRATSNGPTTTCTTGSANDTGMLLIEEIGI